jgi:hypothetical protein
MKQTVYLRKSDKQNKKWMVTIENKTVHFGANGYSDYTKHKDEDRMKSYTKRHKVNENWGKSGLRTAGFWSKWVLWNKPSFTGSLKDMETRFNLKIVRDSTKRLGNSPKKSGRSPNKSSRSPKRRSRSPKRRSRSPKRRSRSPKRRSRSPKRRSSSPKGSSPKRRSSDPKRLGRSPKRLGRNPKKSSRV